VVVWIIKKKEEFEMKTSFFRILPLTAAVLLATSCSKDENNDKEVVNNSPANVVIEKSVVKIPFSVKVNQGKTLSKIAYSGSESSVTVSFTEDDVNNGTTLTVTGEGITESTLTLEKQGDSYVFKGDINLSSDEYKASFESGDITLTGSFGTAETTTKSSTVSLADLMENCNHQYLATFKSDATSIDLYDQNSYIEFTVAKGQYKVNIGENWYPEGEGKIIDQELNKLWVVVPSGSVSGHFIKAGSTVDAGKIYTITRTDVIDLGVGNVLWKTTNETSGTATSYSQSDAATSVYKDEKYYTWSDAKDAFGTSDAPKEGSSFRLPTEEEFQALAALDNNTDLVTVNGMSCKEFSNDKGALFLPAAGLNGGDLADNEGYYWSGETPSGKYILQTSCMKFTSSAFFVYKVAVNNMYSVRLVRGL
jgi:uncharacterized protein (TIGR02145 family)